MKIPDNIRTVIFDLDGTIYDKRGLAHRMVRRLWWCLPLLAAERVARRTMHNRVFGSEQAFYQAFFVQMARGHWWTAGMAEKWYHHIYLPAMIHLIAKYCKPRAEVLSLIDNIDRNIVTMAVYSDYGCVDDKLRALGMDLSLFSLRMDAPSTGALKPARTSAEKAMKALSADPQTTIFIGDRDDKDGASARAVGAEFLLVN
ncbi:MAG: HAD family hydrolase [Paludibacteraceae bacterium]|nr:HAD family hydrolase [Paludibacteraceae bacterium]